MLLLSPALMPKKKARSQRPSIAHPNPTQDEVNDDNDNLVDDLLAQLDDTPLQSHPSQPSQPALPKQNAKSRFLARQARRVAAVAQASPQVDPIAQERLQQEINEEEDAIRRACDRLGLEKYDINPDGHCLFSAVADQLSLLGIISKSQSTYVSVRRAAADYMQSHPDDFIPFLPSFADEAMTHDEFEQYCASIRDTAEWGGEPEILALSRVYNIPIHVVQGGSPSIVKHDPMSPDINPSEKRIVFISYHRKMYGLGEHYNSLHRKGTS